MPVIANPNGNGFISVSDEQAAKLDSATNASEEFKLPEHVTTLGKMGQPVQMADPSGKLWNVPATDQSYKQAIDLGWRDATTEERSKEAKIEAAQSQGAGEVFGKQLSNEILFGVPGMVAHYQHTPEQNEIADEAERRDLEKHPIAGYGGKALGFAGDLAIPGVGAIGDAAKLGVEGGGRIALSAAEHAAAEGLGKEAAAKMLETSLTRKVAGSAAKYAAESAVYSAPQTLVQAAYGDPEKAAETMMWSVGLGGALGGVGRLASEGGSALLNASSRKFANVLATKEANGFSRVDNIIRKKIYGLSDSVFDKDANKMSEATLQRVLDRADTEGLSGLTNKQRPAAIQSMLDDSGKKLADYRSKAESLINENPDLKASVPSFNEIANEAEQEANKRFPNLQNSTLFSAENKQLQNILDEMRAKGDERSITGMRELKSNIEKSSKAYNRESLHADIGRFVSNIIKTKEEAALQHIFQAGEMPEGLADFLVQKERYMTGKTLEATVNTSKGTGELPTLSPFKPIGTLAYGIIGGHPLAIPAAAAQWAYKAFVDNKAGLLGKSLSFLKNVAKDPNSVDLLGGIMANEGVKALQAHLDKLPSIITRDRLVTRSVAALNPAQHFTGDTAGLSKEAQYKRLVDTIQQAQIDTATTAEHTGAIASHFAADPKLASLLTQKQLGALSYLSSQIPKGPPRQPFQSEAWKPTKEQQTEFLTKARVVADPMSVLHSYQEGSLSRVEVETLKAIYPKIYQDMVHKVLETAYDQRTKPVKEVDKVQLSLLTGVPLDQTVKNLQAIQQAISSPPAAQPEQQQPQQGGGRGHHKSGGSGLSKQATNMETPTTRRTYR